MPIVPVSRRSSLALLVERSPAAPCAPTVRAVCYSLNDTGSPVESAQMVIGYSDRINHALAFAAKHHDRQVRKGTRLPYLTHPASVAIILTRYGQDDETVVAGILHDVIEDCVREAY